MEETSSLHLGVSSQNTVPNLRQNLFSSYLGFPHLHLLRGILKVLLNRVDDIYPIKNGVFKQVHLFAVFLVCC